MYSISIVLFTALAASLGCVRLNNESYVDSQNHQRGKTCLITPNETDEASCHAMKSYFLHIPSAYCFGVGDTCYEYYGQPISIHIIKQSDVIYPRSMDGRIVNGIDADEDVYPFQVSIRYNGRHFCGGSIVDEMWILTAAHCFDPHMALQLMTVQAGTIDISREADGSEKGVVKPISGVVIHKEYMAYNGHYNDIALIRLQSPLEFNVHIQPVTLPRQLEETPANTPVTVIGWGMNYTGGPIMTKLQVVENEIVSDADCLVAFHGDIHATNICAGVPEGGKGACMGDSGGPLVTDDKQVGIVSWSILPCALKGFPVVYTEVSYYIDWITAITRGPSHGDIMIEENLV